MLEAAKVAETLRTVANFQTSHAEDVNEVAPNHHPSDMP